MIMKHADIISMMILGFPNQADKWTDANLKLYVRILKDIPVDELEAVVVQLLADGGDFIPSVSAIRNKWRELSHDISQPTEDEALEIVMREITRTGHSGVPRFENETITLTVRQMGWREICLSDVINVWQAQFKAAYRRNLQRADERAKLLPEVRQAIEAGAITGPRQIGAIVRQLVDRGQ
jgi:hypothetical protein